MKFSSDQIVRVSNWGYWYVVNGQHMVGDYPVDATWPDGTVEQALLRIVPGDMRYNDMGHECTGPNDAAMLVTVRHGQEFHMEWRPGASVRFSTRDGAR